MKVCSSCHAGCCRRFHVPLTGYDILKIKQDLNLEYLDFLQLIPVSDEYLPIDSKTRAIFKFNNIGANNNYVLYLRSINSRLIHNSDKCIFLQEWNGEDFALPGFRGIKARCGIYNSRPLACTIYPAKLHENELIGVVKVPNPEELNPAYHLCPADINGSDFSEDSNEIMKNLVLYKYEKNYFKFLAETWNQGEGDFGEFFEFLKAAYEKRILIE